MKISTKEMRDGLHDEKVVFICHYLKLDINKKPLRNVPPTLVKVRSNDFLPKNKTIYYSTSHFKKLNKNSKMVGSAISPVDNTGYRTMPGNELHIFDNKDECINEWNKQVNEYLDRYSEYAKSFVSQIELTKKEIKSLIVESEE